MEAVELCRWVLILWEGEIGCQSMCQSGCVVGRWVVSEFSAGVVRKFDRVGELGAEVGGGNMQLDCSGKGLVQW